ncbi:hypothetical protein IAT40_002962 [Kwoniella sp. CBS 6097]
MNKRARASSEPPLQPRKTRLYSSEDTVDFRAPLVKPEPILQEDPKATEKQETVNEPEITINEVNEGYQFEDSDITLISSDNLHFKVHSYHLLAASPIFRDMIKLGTEAEKTRQVPFTDDKIETGEIIRLFLDMCYGKDTENLTSDTLPPFSSLVLFLAKYDCLLWIRAVREVIMRGLINSTTSPDCAFDLAVLMEDSDLAASAIRLAGAWTHVVGTKKDTDQPKKKRRPKVLRSVHGGGVSLLTAVHYDFFTRIPDDYKFALLRASREAGMTLDQKKAPWPSVAKKFKEVMEAIHAEDPSTSEETPAA